MRGNPEVIGSGTVTSLQLLPGQVLLGVTSRVPVLGTRETSYTTNPFPPPSIHLEVNSLPPSFHSCSTPLARKGAFSIFPCSGGVTFPHLLRVALSQSEGEGWAVCWQRRLTVATQAGWPISADRVFSPCTASFIMFSLPAPGSVSQLLLLSVHHISTTQSCSPISPSQRHT